MAAHDPAAPSLAAILNDFTDSTTTAHTALLRDPALIQPPAEGISLLDAKNEIFLAYVQALALRNLEVLRQFGKSSGSVGEHDADKRDDEMACSLNESITKKLVELRVYLEKGVRPLESRLKFRLDRIVKTADEEDGRAAKAALAKQRLEVRKAANDSEDEDDEDDEDDGEDEEDDDPTSFRPNVAMMLSNGDARQNAAETIAARQRKSLNDPSDGIYRPPRISATAMPSHDGETGREKPSKQRQQRSAALDEYIDAELSTQPRAEPSIGSTITAGGRRTKTARQLRDEAERRTYEETNLVRLPALSKKERAKSSGRGAQDGGFGGDEWRGIGESVDRITGLTRRKKSSEGVLDRSRKRSLGEDGPRGDGRAVHGEQFEQKRRRLAKKGRI